MENASKALIIAGAILISILLISLAILLFNSASGVSDNAENAGEVISSAATQENVKIILGTMDIKNDDVFNNYIKSKYENKQLTADEVVELCILVVERNKKITGKGYAYNETHITSLTSPSTTVVYWNETDQKLYYQNFDNDKKYKMVLYKENAGYEGNYSIRIKKAN